MKVRFLRDEQIFHPDIVGRDYAETLRNVATVRDQFNRGDLNGREMRERIWIWVNAGYVMDHPEAWRLVLIGMAEPVDEECMRKLGPEVCANVDALLRKYDKLRVAQLSGDPKLDASDKQAERILQREEESKRGSLFLTN